MDIFNCDPTWPICLFDFTCKNKCPNFFRFRVGAPLDSFIQDDYFNETQTGGNYTPPILEHKVQDLLIERNEHLCTNQKLVQNYKTRFKGLDDTLFNAPCLNFLFENEIMIRDAKNEWTHDLMQTPSL